MSKQNLTTKPKRRKVMFTLDAPQAREVFVAGDFNEWNKKAHPLKKNAKGVWQKTAMLFPGRYEYKFIVDGKWERDPKNSQTCLNCFGTRNCVIDLASK